MRAACATTLLFGLVQAGCGFSPAGSVTDAPVTTVDSAVDAPPPIPRWVVAGVTTMSGSYLTVHPLAATFGAPCAHQTSPAFAYRSLLSHPDLPYAYGVESAFWGFALGCSAVTSTMVPGGGPRPIQRIVLDSSASVGFFTADGPLATGVYRFTTQPTGTPAAGGNANAPSAAGALALVPSDAQLFVAGTSAIYEYTLVGATLDFPTSNSQMTAPMCGAPVDLVPSGDSVYAFCSDASDIRRYTRSPFVYAGTAGTLGSVSEVLPLPSDRAIAATVSPSALVVLSFGAGPVMMQVGPSLPSSVTAMAASDDGSVVVTAVQTDPNTSEISAWAVTGTTITKLDSQSEPGTVTSLTITKPGT